MDVSWFERFEEYHQGVMNIKEKQHFEAELSSNEEMKLAFDIYRTVEMEMRSKAKHSEQERELRHMLQGLNAKYFDLGSKIDETPVVSLRKRKSFGPVRAIAASLLLLLAAYFLFFLTESSPGELASEYYASNFQELGQTMDGTQDSLQRGIVSYNDKDMEAASRYFRDILSARPGDYEATQYLGLVYLAKGEYDNAIKQFDELAKRDDLYSNPGMFLKALSLLLRGGEGDQEQARELLERVVEQKAEGRKQAEEWLKAY